MSDNSDKTMLFVHALTGLHPGSGTGIGVIDLPVQRERHTDWPIIPGSSLKGVLRAECARADGDNREDETALAAFGPNTDAASDHAGALAFSDARVLAFPVRSLTGVFAWVTCQAVLTRLARDLKIAGGGKLPDIPDVAKDCAACVDDSPLIAADGRLLLEEFEFSRTGDGDMRALGDWVARHAVRDPGTAGRLCSHLAVLHDDDFTHFVRHATETVARVGLDYESKTVRRGALFYEEYVPAETLFYSLVLSSKSRRPDARPNAPETAAEILSWLRHKAPATLQIGGGETVGKGFCALRFSDEAGEGEQ